MIADSEPYDGKRLMDLVKIERSPFKDVWDVKVLTQEIE